MIPDGPLSLRAAVPKRQAGLSFLGALLVIAVIASAVTLILRLGPHYIDFYTLKSVIEGLPADRVHEMTRPDIREALEKRFKVNNLRDFKVSDVITVERLRDNTVLQLAYERREHLFLNVDVVLVFSERYQYP